MLRRTALALLAVALLLAAWAQPAQGVPPPTLTGEEFRAEGPYPLGDLEIRCRTNADGTDTYFFEGSGPASAPYEGTFTETGEVTVSEDPGPSVLRDVLSLRSEFTIDSSSGQVSGTKRLVAPVEDASSAHCDPDGRGYIDMFNGVPVDVNYSATITTTGGVFADRGQGGLLVTFERHSCCPVYFHSFRETFTSDLISPTQQGTTLFGKRTPGASFSAMSANAKRAVGFPLYFPATVRKIHAFIDGKGATSGSQTLRGVIYGNAGGAPGARLGRTFQVTVRAGMSGRWLELYLAPAIRLNPGAYWLGLHSGTTGGVARFGWDPRENSRRFNVDYYPDGESNPFGSAALDNQGMSIFVSGSY